MGGVRGAGAAEVNEKSDQKINRADGILIINGGIGDIFADDDGGAEGDAFAADCVEGGAPAPDGLEETGDLVRLADGEIVDLGEHVAGADALVGGGTAGGDLEGVDGAGAVYPRNSIVGKAKLALLLEVDEGAAYRGDGHDDQEGADKLALQSAQDAVVPTRFLLKKRTATTARTPFPTIMAALRMPLQTGGKPGDFGAISAINSADFRHSSDFGNRHYGKVDAEAEAATRMSWSWKASPG